MLKQERHAHILHQLNLHNKLLNADLCKELDVSEDTVRRDLQELSFTGKLIKVHGGALSPAFNQIQIQPTAYYSHAHKAIIAKKAVELIKNGMFLLTSGGTTILELAHILPKNLHATFITGSVPAINVYSSYPNIDVIVVGGKLSKDSKLTVGSDAITKINSFYADICFLGINAIDTQKGITDNDGEVVAVKKAMVQSAAKVVCMTISEKLQTIQPMQVCALNKIDYLITELDADDEKLAPFRDAGINVL